MRKIERPPLPDYYGKDTQFGDKRFGGSHPGVLNIVLADGAGLTISYFINEDVFERLGHAQDGTVVDVSALQ